MPMEMDKELQEAFDKIGNQFSYLKKYGEIKRKEIESES